MFELNPSDYTFVLEIVGNVILRSMLLHSTPGQHTHMNFKEVICLDDCVVLKIQPWYSSGPAHSTHVQYFHSFIHFTL